jgi:hypothetical protein
MNQNLPDASHVATAIAILSRNSSNLRSAMTSDATEAMCEEIAFSLRDAEVKGREDEREAIAVTFDERASELEREAIAWAEGVPDSRGRKHPAPASSASCSHKAHAQRCQAIAIRART